MRYRRKQFLTDIPQGGIDASFSIIAVNYIPAKFDSPRSYNAITAGTYRPSVIKGSDV